MGINKNILLGEGILYSNYDNEKTILGITNKNNNKNIIFWHLNYRNSLGDIYKNPMLKLSKNAIDLLNIEVDCLKAHKIKIHNINYEDGFIIIKDKIKPGENILETFKTKDLVPYVYTRPIQYLCDINGVHDGKYKIR